MASVSVSIECSFEEVEPNGSRCYCCRDACYFAMWLLVVRANGKVCDMEPSIALCGSCHDAMEATK